jgi:hypothetical protein
MTLKEFLSQPDTVVLYAEQLTELFTALKVSHNSKTYVIPVLSSTLIGDEFPILRHNDIDYPNPLYKAPSQ